jgi:hypothetical protein
VVSIYIFSPVQLRFLSLPATWSVVQYGGIYLRILFPRRSHVHDSRHTTPPTDGPDPAVAAPDIDPPVNFSALG